MKKVVSGVMLALILISTLIMAFNIELVKAADGAIYIRADGSVDPPTAPIITYDYITYTLTDNIKSSGDGIVVERDNIVIDGAGYTLQGIGAPKSKGIDLSGRTNVTVRNTQISNFYCGIWLDYSSYNVISGNSITKNRNYGIWLNYSSSNIISGNNITINDDQCVWLDYSSYNVISGNSITKNQGMGVCLYASSNNVICANRFANNCEGVDLRQSSNNNVISGNDITNNRGDGVSLYYSSNNVISENNITYNIGFLTGDGINLQRSSNNNTIIGNNIAYNADNGIVLINSIDNLISGNTIACNKLYGLSLSSSNNVIRGNTFINDGLVVYSYRNAVEDNTVNGKPLVYLEGVEDYNVSDAGQVILVNCNRIRVENLNLFQTDKGVQLLNTHNSTIFGNNITTNYFGIDLLSSSNNIISGNNIANNRDNPWGYGIHLEYSLKNIISGNNIANNRDGVVLTCSSNNSIYGNMITNNYKHGIKLIYSSNNVISENNIKNNYYAIYLYDSANNNVISGNNIKDNYYGIDLYESSNNWFYYNNFTNNIKHVYIEMSGYANLWDGGYPFGGNYWSGYIDVDLYCGPYQNETGGDGIWDHPYVINKNNVDRYPLVNPFQQPAWSLAVTVYDWDGAGAALVGGDTWVELIMEGEASGITQYINRYSQAVFHNVEAGSYYVNVWHRPPESIASAEFWAQKTSIKVEEGKPTTIEVTRHMPIITQFKVDEAPSKVGEPASLSVKVKNIDSAVQWVKVKIIIRNESAIWIYQKETDSKALQPQEEATFIFDDFTPSREGAYYGYAICNIVGGGSQTTDQEGWRYLFTLGASESVILNFDVYCDNQLYKVSLEVPYSRFNELVGQISSNYYSWYPNINPTILQQAYYVERHVRSPNNYPINKVIIYLNDQKITQNELKTKVLSGLMNYCLELFGAAHPAILDTYITYSNAWFKAYQDIAPWVKLSNTVSNILDWATIIGPIIDSIKNLYGGTTSERVKATVSLFFDLFFGYQALKEKYGDDAANAITNILIDFGLCPSQDYNPLELYAKFEDDPSKMLDALEEIESEVFNLELNSDAKTIMLNSLTELTKSMLGEFAQGTALSLYAYFGSGLTASTAAKIGLRLFLEDLVKDVIPLALANAIMEGYVLPMAEAINSAWESMGNIANTYTYMYVYGVRIAYPQNNIFNLTESKIFSALLGSEYLTEYNYYVKTYFYRSRQLFKSQSELEYYKSMAQTLLSYAQNWANTLRNIQNMAKAIIEASDPDGEQFNFELIPPPETIPYYIVPEDSKGFIIEISNSTNVTLQSGNYTFLIQNGLWYSNFTYPLYAEDPYGKQYIILFNPPDQTYAIKTANETSLKLSNFELSNGTLTTTKIGEISGTTVQFNITNYEIDPNTVIPEFASSITMLGFLVLMAIPLVLIWKRRGSQLNHKL